MNQKSILEKLLPEEQKIYKVKYSSPAISKLDQASFIVVVRALLVKINVITGWSLPTEKEHREILVDQFMKKLLESYENVNCDEIEYAFRHYPVTDWGKNMNLNLISEVMSPYLEERREVSLIEERNNKPKELPAPENKEPWTDDEQVETARKLYKMLKTYRCITQKVAAILFRQGKIEKPNYDDKEIILKQATQDYFEEQRTEGKNYGDSEIEIRKICNQILCAAYFNKV